MERIWIYTLAVILTLSFTSATPARAAQHISIDDQGREYVTGEIIVKFRGSTGAAAASHYKSMYSIKAIETFENTEIRQQQLPDNMTVEQAIDLYNADPDVEYAEPNYVYRQMATPNDTYKGILWGLHNTGQVVNGTSGTFDADIDAEEAWDLNTGSTQVVVAVIDSGVDYNHPDISANIWTNTGEIASNGIDDDGNGYIDDVKGWDFVHDDNTPMDVTGHGTHVAGSIAARGNNAYGITGVSWQASIMPLRFINAAGYGTTADAIQAIEYAEANGAMVINNSWGGTSYSAALKSAIDATSAVVVCSAGNSGNNLDVTPEYPAAYSSANIISVAATDQNDSLAAFSNYSVSLVDVAAPGTNIYSAKPPRTTVWSDTFGDGSISDWASGGTNNNWAIETAGPYAGLGVITESPGGVNYLNSTDAWIRAPQVNLSARNGSQFEFRIIGASEADQDILKVEASDNGTTWTQVPVNVGDIVFDNVSGTLSAWQSAVADIGAYDGQGTVYVRFRFTTNSSGVTSGFSIDDAAITCAGTSYSGTEYQYMNGTSMAAAYVSGVAALLYAEKPTLAHTEIKFVIENSVDGIAGLSTDVASGGRINAYSALTSIASVSLSSSPASTSEIDLSWSTSNPVDSGFEIERRTSTEGDFSTIAILDADDSAFNDTSLSQGTTYYYRVHTLSSGTRTGYSNESASTTFSASASTSGGGGGGGGGGCFISAAGGHFLNRPAGLMIAMLLACLLIMGAVKIIKSRIEKTRFEALCKSLHLKHDA